MRPSPLFSRSACLATAAVAGCFVLIAAGVLLDNHRRSRAAIFVDTTAIGQLKEQLRQRPTDEAIKTQLRQLDLELRQQFFRRKLISRRGHWLLVGGLAAMLLAIGAAGGLARPRLPPPASSPDRHAAGSRWAIAATGIVLLGAAIGIAPPPMELPGAALAPEPAAPPAAPPTRDQLAAQWPRFRGPGGGGMAPDRTPPATWDLDTGHHVRWRAAIPLHGQSSPLVWDDRVFLTGATSTTRQLYCYQASTGQLLWQATIQTPRSATIDDIYHDTGYAPCTGVVDGRRVTVIFANGDLAAFDLAGQQAWAINLGLPDNLYGHAASLEQLGDTIVVQMDQGHGGDGRSRLFAIDAATGEIAWEVARDDANTWASPLVIHPPGGPQIVCNGNPLVTAYEPESGDLIWQADLLYGEVVASPVYANDIVYIASAGAVAAAIRPDGTGDVTESHVLWKTEDGLPDIVSPWTDGERLLLIVDGAVTCLAADTGNLLWEHDLEVQVWASPTLAGDRLYVPTQSGQMIVFTIDDTGLRELARLPLGAPCSTSPAFVGSRIYVRTQNELLCLGEPE